MSTGWKIAIAIIAIIGLIVLAVVIAKATTPQPVVTTQQQQSGTGFSGNLGNIIAGAIGGFLGNLFGGGGKDNDTPATVQCDPNRAGYELDGTPNANCGKDYTGCVAGKCNPNRYGYDECGFPNVNCGFGRFGQ